MEKTAATLFGKARQAVLTSLFEEPARKFYMRELSRTTGIGTGPLQHELTQLVGADLVIREPDGNRVNYRANTGSPVFPELLGIIQKTCGISNVIAKALEPLENHVSHAAIYGSIAKGSNQSRSDVDLLVLGDVEFADLVGLLAPVETRLGREISVRLFSEAQFRRLIEDGDRFVMAVTGGPLLIVKGEWDGFRDAARSRAATGTDGRN